MRRKDKRYLEEKMRIALEETVPPPKPIFTPSKGKKSRFSAAAFLSHFWAKVCPFWDGGKERIEIPAGI